MFKARKRDGEKERKLMELLSYNKFPEGFPESSTKMFGTFNNFLLISLVKVPVLLGYLAEDKNNFVEDIFARKVSY